MPLIALTLLYLGLLFSFFSYYNQRFELKVLSANRVSTLNLKFRVFVEKADSALLDSKNPEIESMITDLVHDTTEITTRFSTSRSTLESVLPKSTWKELQEGNQLWNTFAKEVLIGIDTGISGPSGRERFIVNLKFRKRIHEKKLENVRAVLNAAETTMKSSLVRYQTHLTFWLIFIFSTYVIVVVLMQYHPLLSFRYKASELPGFLISPSRFKNEIPTPEDNEVPSQSNDSHFPDKTRINDLTRQLSEKTKECHELTQIIDQLNAEKEKAPTPEPDNSEQRNKFLAKLSHEIRTPLSGIMGMVELLYETPINKEQEEIITILKSSNRNMLQLVNSMIDFGSDDLPKTKPVNGNRDFKLNDVVGEAAFLFAEKAHRKGIELELMLSSTIPEKVRGKRNALYQIIVNLIVNAIRYTDKGGVIVKVSKDNSKKSKGIAHIVLTVTDSGSGVPEELRDSLFTHPEQEEGLDRSSSYGTGLGLTISKTQIDQMGGNISYKPLSRGGSEFKLEIPFEIVANKRMSSSLAKFPQIKIFCATQSTILKSVILSNAKIFKFEPHFFENLDQMYSGLDSKLSDSEEIHGLFIDESIVDQDRLFAFFKRVDERIQELDFKDNYFLSKFVISPIASKKISKEIINERTDTGFLYRPIRLRNLAFILNQIEHRHPTLPDVVRHRERVVPQINLKVLAVEDTTISQELFSRQLELLGVDFKIVPNGEKALETQRSNSFDIILMDCNLPGMDGFETTRLIRQNEASSGIHIIGITADASPESRNKALEAGMDDYLTKPLSLQQLESAIYSCFPEFLF